MKAVIQRVTHASVTVEGKLISSIGQGLLVLAGWDGEDTEEDVDWMAGTVCRLRIFSDAEGLMNLSVEDIKGEILVVSQFTLHALTKKGNRPSFINAARPEQAIPLYNAFIQKLKDVSSLNVVSGIFGADMKVELLNDGPVTIVMDTRNKE